jgi:hypothetical protein
MRISELNATGFRSEKHRLLAELAGIIVNGQPIEGYCWCAGLLFTTDSGGLPDEAWNPDRDYNVIIPLVQKLGIANRVSAITHNMGRTYSIESTPSQLCDAVLVAAGKAEL